MKNHPLFPEKPEADVVSIHVTRFEGGSKKWSPQKFAGEGLTEVGTIYELYGGGSYELIAHGETAKGKMGIVARADYSFSGAPKPLNPNEPTAAPAAPGQAPAASGGETSGGLIGVLLQQAGEDRRMMMQMLANMSNRPPPPADNSAMNAMVAVMQGQTQLLASVLARPTAPASATAGMDGAVKMVLDVMEAGANLREGAIEAIAAKGATGELDLDKLASGAEKVIGVIKQARELAESGASPEQAAAAAAAAAE